MAFELESFGLREIPPVFEMSKLNSEQMWALVEGLVKKHELMLFDLDLPQARHGVMRVYVSGMEGRAVGVTLDQVAKISRELDLLLDAESGIEYEYTLEVSTPGINRRLRRAEHFSGAVGERVKIVTRSPTKETLCGKILGVTASGPQNELEIELEEESKAQRVSLLFSQIDKARIDFVFA